jgi:glycosyltransferase involved in cell wall biosynthesis
VSSRLLRVAHLLDKNRLTSGSVVQMVEAAQGLAARGHQVVVGSRPGGDLEDACKAAGMGFAAVPLRHPFDLETARRLRALLRQQQVEVVHVHKGVAHALALIAASGLGWLPRVVVNRGVSFPLDILNRWKYRHPRVAAVVCVAAAVCEVVKASGGVRPQRVHVVHAGTDCRRFDPERFDREALRAELGFGPQELLVGQVSVRDWKGWRELVQAFVHIARQWPGARLLLVGCEPQAERRKVEAAARELGVEDRLRTLPFRADMPQVLAACEVVVDASWAGTGITGTVREAMAMARPVVATDCGGNRELVVDHEVGLLVPPRDVNALAEAIATLLGDGRLRQRMGRAGRQRVVEQFSTARRIERLEALYRQVVGEEG